MKSVQDIVDLGLTKIREAELLFNNGFHDMAFYIGGYSIELLLKPKSAKRSIFLTFLTSMQKAGSYPQHQKRGAQQDNLYKPFKVYDYEQLIILCGPYTEIQTTQQFPMYIKSNFYI